VTVSVITDDRAATGSPRLTEPSDRIRKGSPVTLLRVYAVLLVLIPPTHIIDPLGAIGTPATVVALAALLLWTMGVLTPGNYLCRTVVAVRVVMGVVVGTTLLGYAVLHVRWVPVVELLASDRALLQVLSWAGVALLAAEGLRDRDELYSVLRALVGAVAVMAVVGFLQFRFTIDLTGLADRIPGLQENANLVSIQDRSGFNRPAGTATHPIEFGSVIAMSLPLALHLARFDVARSAIRRWVPVVAIMTGIPVAVSRSAVLAAVVAAIVLFAGLDPRQRPRALAAVAAFIVATYATTPGLLGTLRNLFVHAGEDQSVTLRTSDYEVVEEYVRQSPWLGRGPGTFVASSYTILDNQYLLTAIEIGLVGVLVVIGYFLATAFLGRGARHRTEDPAVRDLGQAMAATSLAGAVAAVTFDAFSFLMFAGFVPLCLGIAGALRAMQPAERRIVTERAHVAAWDLRPWALRWPAGGSSNRGSLRRVVALVGAGLAVAVLAALPFTLGGGAEGSDSVAARSATPAIATPTSTSTTSASRATPTTAARPDASTTTSPARTGNTATTGPAAAPEASPSSPTSPLANGSTTDTTTDEPAPPDTTVPPAPTTTDPTTTSTTSTSTTTSSTTTSTTTTTAPPEDGLGGLLAGLLDLAP
jgi:hypothetical protein